MCKREVAVATSLLVLPVGGDRMEYPQRKVAAQRIRVEFRMGIRKFSYTFAGIKNR